MAGSLVLLLLTTACYARSARRIHSRAAGIVHSYILVESQTGRIIEAGNPDREAHPASLTKLMTLYLTFQRLDEGKLTLRTRLHVSRHAAAQEPMKLWLRPGSTITVRDAILGITTKSANDAAVVLGEAIGGSELHFASLMNREARRLGMDRTRFYNASGLPDRRQVTTARDMATLGIALIHTFPQYYRFFGVHAFRFHGEVVWGHNHLLDLCDGVDGMKTGYIHASGYNVVTSALRGGRRLVGVVLGGATAHARDLEMIALMNRGFSLHPMPRILNASTADAPAAAPKSAHATKLVPAAIEIDTQPQRDWVVQVGAGFPTQRSARRILSRAGKSAPLALHRGHRVVVRLRGRGYRARFSGLTDKQARMACSALRHKKFTCHILAHAAPHDEELAAATDSGAARETTSSEAGQSE